MTFAPDGGSAVTWAVGVALISSSAAWGLADPPQPASAAVRVVATRPAASARRWDVIDPPSLGRSAAAVDALSESHARHRCVRRDRISPWTVKGMLLRRR